MSKRHLVSIACTMLLVPVPVTAEAAAESRPNVLFIAVDDLNDWTGSLGGHPQTRTPNLDRLTARGVLFTRAYCAAPACNPSRAALLTGIRPSRSGAYLNSNVWRKCLPEAITLPRYFLDQGYRVEGGGKIFHGGQNDLDSWHAYFKQPADPMPPGRPLNGIPGTAHFDWGPVDATDADMGDGKVVEWAEEFLSRKQEKPFFLAVGLYRPHLPWYVPKKYFEDVPPEKVRLPTIRDDDLDDVPPIGRRMARPEGDHRKVVASNNWERAVSGYLASIRFCDAMVGRVIDALDRSPHAKDTIIVLWGDHGWHLGEKLHWRKFALWEEATRVPLVVVAPGITAEKRRCGRTVSLLDLYPTLVELCGLEPKGGLDGRSLVPLLRDPEAAWDRPVVTTHGYRNHAVRSEKWRYIRYLDGTEELYDHEKDPLEWTNLADREEHAGTKKRLSRWLPRTDAEEGPRRGGSAPRAKKSGRKVRSP
jgi:arylsulfatase A-like enzyme